jgi:hypothetical protein
MASCSATALSSAWSVVHQGIAGGDPERLDGQSTLCTHYVQFIILRSSFRSLPALLVERELQRQVIDISPSIESGRRRSCHHPMQLP